MATNKKEIDKVNAENLARENSAKQYTSSFEIASVYDRTSKNEDGKTNQKKDSALMIAVLSAIDSGNTNVVSDDIKIKFRVKAEGKSEMIDYRAKTFIEKCFLFGITRDKISTGNCSIRFNLVVHPKGTAYYRESSDKIEIRGNDITFNTGDFTMLAPEKSFASEMAESLSKTATTMEDKIALVRAMKGL
jgi:hypothetical protein